VFERDEVDDEGVESSIAGRAGMAPPSRERKSTILVSLVSRVKLAVLAACVDAMMRLLSVLSWS
jgi:hypothetical protein